MKIVLGATVTAVNKNRNNVTKKHHGMMTLFIPKKCCTRPVHRDTAVKTKINKSNIYIYIRFSLRELRKEVCSPSVHRVPVREPTNSERMPAGMLPCAATDDDVTITGETPAVIVDLCSSSDEGQGGNATQSPRTHVGDERDVSRWFADYKDVDDVANSAVSSATSKLPKEKHSEPDIDTINNGGSRPAMRMVVQRLGDPQTVVPDRKEVMLFKHLPLESVTRIVQMGHNRQWNPYSNWTVESLFELRGVSRHFRYLY